MAECALINLGLAAAAPVARDSDGHSLFGLPYQLTFAWNHSTVLLLAAIEEIVPDETTPALKLAVLVVPPEQVPLDSEPPRRTVPAS